MDIKPSDILKTPELMDVENRFDYVIGLGAIGLIAGEVGSGKSTALRYALIAAAENQSPMVNAEHVQLAATEIL